MQFPLNLQSKEDDTPHIDLDEGNDILWFYIMSLVMEILLFIMKELCLIHILSNKK